jgi:hypothetical protein
LGERIQEGERARHRERDDKACEKHSDPIFHAFAIPHNDLMLGEIDVFYAEPQTFHQSQAGAVEQVGHQLIGTGDVPNHPHGLFLGQNRRQAFGLWGPDSVGSVERLPEHVTAEEQRSAEDLILGRRRGLLMNGQVRPTRLDFRAGHLVGIAFVLEENLPFNPGDIGFRPTNRLVLEPHGIAHGGKTFLRTVWQG